MPSGTASPQTPNSPHESSDDSSVFDASLDSSSILYEKRATFSGPGQNYIYMLYTVYHCVLCVCLALNFLRNHGAHKTQHFLFDPSMWVLETVQIGF